MEFMSQTNSSWHTKVWCTIKYFFKKINILQRKTKSLSCETTYFVISHIKRSAGHSVTVKDFIT